MHHKLEHDTNCYLTPPLIGSIIIHLIGSYHEMFTSLDNYDKSLNMLHHNVHMRLFVSLSHGFGE